MNIEHLFDNTVDTYRLTESQDSLFSPVSSFYEYLTTLSCRIQKRRGFEPVEGGRKFSKTSYVLFCKNDTDLQLKDAVLYDGETYLVVDIEYEGNEDTYLKVSLERKDVEVQCIRSVWGVLADHTTETEDAKYIWDLTGYNGKIYGGTRQQLLEYNYDDEGWTIASQELTNTNLHVITEFNNKLYIGTEAYNTGGLGGYLFEWNGSDTLTQVAPRLTGTDIFSTIYDMIVFNGELYAGANNSGLLKWNGTDAWIEVVNNGTLEYFHALAVLNNELYIGSNSGELYRWNGDDTVTKVANIVSNCPNIKRMVTFDNGDGETIYAVGGASWSIDEGYLLKWNGSNAWSKVARKLESNQGILEDIVVWNNEIYAAELTRGHIYKWNGSNAWEVYKEPLVDTATRCQSLAVGTSDNLLYQGTGFGGGESTEGRLLGFACPEE